MNTIKMCSLVFFTVFYFRVAKAFPYLRENRKEFYKTVECLNYWLQLQQSKNSGLKPAQFNAIAIIDCADESLDKYVHLHKNEKLTKPNY